MGGRGSEGAGRGGRDGRRGETGVLIGELSRRTAVPAHLLRYYEAQGLLEPARSAGGYREYTDDAVLTVTQIRKLLEAGLSTQEIALMLPCATGAAPELEPCPELLEVLRARLHEVDERIDTLLHSRRALHDYIDATERQVPGEPAPGQPAPGQRQGRDSTAGTRRRASSDPADTRAEARPSSPTAAARPPTAEATPISTSGQTNSPAKNAAVHRPVPRPRSA
ncbi:MerR family transcriptional regulator [Streptomyces sp. NPDC057474]|uniref:MerR family transcriptional regulator n=1 Tax=Streptomyces sp. NPDC057474 TaxID=3346144 RepID=UPI00367959A2